MDSISDVIDRLGGVTAVAAELGLPLGTVSAWKTRGSIPANQWAAVIRLAEEKGIADLNYGTLAELAARRRPSFSGAA